MTGEPLHAGLAAQQEALVRAIAAGGPPPPGFDADRVAAAARSILYKRAGDVARAWPALAESYGPRWKETYAAWAEGRPTNGSIRDAWDFAREHAAELSAEAARELALTEARWSYDGKGAPRRRRAAVRRVPGGLVVQIMGRARLIGPGARR